MSTIWDWARFYKLEVIAIYLAGVMAGILTMAMHQTRKRDER